MGLENLDSHHLHPIKTAEHLDYANSLFSSLVFIGHLYTGVFLLRNFNGKFNAYGLLNLETRRPSDDKLVQALTRKKPAERKLALVLIQVTSSRWICVFSQGQLFPFLSLGWLFHVRKGIKFGLSTKGAHKTKELLLVAHTLVLELR